MSSAILCAYNNTPLLVPGPPALLLTGAGISRARNAEALSVFVILISVFFFHFGFSVFVSVFSVFCHINDTFVDIMNAFSLSQYSKPTRIQTPYIPLATEALQPLPTR